jgi:hypothetical protein
VLFKVSGGVIPGILSRILLGVYRPLCEVECDILVYTLCTCAAIRGGIVMASKFGMKILV